ncbi:zinc-binding dehydrogenase [Saccharomonospora piscinae]|uniref:zinc-binding dehydrogenase n=1 Tax=Saccharomonospora piscinae TaxID=687388 RepID=UPI000464D770|nr:zinc-binding dehydrogenase [Saccharomonospora piscinae]
MHSTGTTIERRVALARRAGGPEVIEVAVETLPEPGPGEALVRVAAAGLNHADSLIRSGGYVVTMPFPLAVGVEAAGTVVAAGDGAAIAPGTRVCGTGWLGSCADHVVVPVERLVPIPDDLGFAEAASIAHAGAAAGALSRVWPLEGRRAAVWGAAGAVGRLLVTRLSGNGTEVIGIAGGERVAVPARLGAAHVVDRTAGDVAEHVREATGGRGVDAVFDPVAAATFHTSLAMLAPRGCLINYGQLGGGVTNAALGDLFTSGGTFVTKFNAGAYVDGFADVAGLIREALELAVRRPEVVTPVAARFPLSEAAAAYRALESGAAGKVLVVVEDG